MQNITEILMSLGIEVPEDKAAELAKKVNENYKTVADYNKQLGKIQKTEGERDDYKARLEAAETTLKSFEGVDLATIQADLAAWKKKAEDAERDYAEKLEARDFDDALKSELDTVQFTSEAARKAVTAEIRSAGLKLKDGKFINGDSATNANTFDGLEKAFTGSSTEFNARTAGTVVNLSTSAAVTTNYADISFLDAEITLKLNFALSSGVESILIGTFTVCQPETYGDTVIVTAQDDMYKTDRAYSTSLVYPTTLYQMFQECCGACGLHYSQASFRNSGFVVAAAPSGELTYRAVLGYIAMLAGGNAHISRARRLEILTYDFEALDAARSGYGQMHAVDAGRDGNIVLISDSLVCSDDGDGNITITGGVFTDGGDVTHTVDDAAYRLAKFRTEAADYMELDSAIFYYLFTELFLMVDSRAKNVFPSFMGEEASA